MSTTNTDHLIIFLDVDGVLLPVPRFTFGGGDLSKTCVFELQNIIKACGGTTHVSIIVSSTWRTSPALFNKLNNFLINVSDGNIPPLSGGTPTSVSYFIQKLQQEELTQDEQLKLQYLNDDPTEQRLVRDRVEEIMRWIRINIKQFPAAAGGRWIAIDDMQLDLDPRMKGHFIKTETEVGLTSESVSKAMEIIKLLPTPEIASERATAALINPIFKNQEIAILEAKCEELEQTVQQITSELQTAKEEITNLQSQKKIFEKEQKETARKIEDMSYRLAQYDCAKRSEAIREALAVLPTRTGKERKELEEHIRKLVNLMRQQKELKKKMRTASKQKAINGE